MTENYSKDRLGLWPETSGSGDAIPSGLWLNDLSDFDYELSEPRESAPSAPIILLSAAFGLVCGIIALYILYQLLGFRIEWSIAFGLMTLFLGVATSSTGLSYVTRSTAIMSNLTFSCGLIFLSILFFGLCIVTGALGATMLLFLSV